MPLIPSHHRTQAERREETDAAPPPPVDEAPRAQRPVLERYEPIRTPSGVLRGEQNEARTPAEQAVAEAYRVFDRYVEEGRRYAAGQSAWNNMPATPPWLGPLAGSTDLIALLARVGSEISKLLQSVGAPTSTANAPVAQPTPATFFHPQQDPAYPKPTAPTIVGGNDGQETVQTEAPRTTQSLDIASTPNATQRDAPRTAVKIQLAPTSGQGKPVKVPFEKVFAVPQLPPVKVPLRRFPQLPDDLEPSERPAPTRPLSSASLGPTVDSKKWRSPGGQLFVAPRGPFDPP